MGKTAKSAAATRSGATAQYKVKKLTPRRISMITEFLTKFIDSPDNTLRFYGSAEWMDSLIEFLREPKRCKSTKMDIQFWLQDKCFTDLIIEIIGSSRKNTRSFPMAMDQSVNRVKSEPMSVDEDDADMPTLIKFDAIKKEVVDLEEEFEDRQGFEHAFQTASGDQDQEGMWKGEEATEMVTEELNDDEFDDKLDGQSQSQVPEEKITKEGLDEKLSLGLNLKWLAGESGKMQETEPSGQGMESKESLKDSSIGSDVAVSSEELVLVPDKLDDDEFDDEVDGGQSESQVPTEKIPKEGLDENLSLDLKLNGSAEACDKMLETERTGQGMKQAEHLEDSSPDCDVSVSKEDKMTPLTTSLPEPVQPQSNDQKTPTMEECIDLIQKSIDAMEIMAKERQRRNDVLDSIHEALHKERRQMNLVFDSIHYSLNIAKNALKSKSTEKKL